MRLTKSALTMLNQHYRAIYKHAYVLGLATVAVSALSVGSANAAGEWDTPANPASGDTPTWSDKGDLSGDAKVTATSAAAKDKYVINGGKTLTVDASGAEVTITKGAGKAELVLGDDKGAGNLILGGDTNAAKVTLGNSLKLINGKITLNKSFPIVGTISFP